MKAIVSPTTKPLEQGVKPVGQRLLINNIQSKKEVKPTEADVVKKEPIESDVERSIDSGELADCETSDGMKNETSIPELPSVCSDDCVGFSDIPIMKVETMKSDNFKHGDGNIAKTNLDEGNASLEVHPSESLDFQTKPKGSAYASIKMSVRDLPKPVDVNICIDTGADFTICDVAFLVKNLGGEDVKKHIYFPSRLPRLRSATGHELELLGKIPLILYFGEYEMKLDVIVQVGDIGMFLLGSDSFYDRLIFDRGRFLAFADDKYPPIPLRYELVRNLVKTVGQFRIAPRSSALVTVKVTDNSRFTGKEVILSPLDDDKDSDTQSCCSRHHEMLNREVPVRNSVSTIDSLGNAFLLVENSTDDILTILPDSEIAMADLISDEPTEYLDGQVNHVLDPDTLSTVSKDGKWPISALKGELADRLPSNIIVQWDTLYGTRKRSEYIIDDESSVHDINYVHDKEERKNLLDGTGEGFPAPPAADSIHPDEKPSDDPEAWLVNVTHDHLSESEWAKLRAVLVRNKEAFSKSKTEIGCCNYFKVDLPLKPGTGYLYNKPRPLPFKHKEMAGETVSELLAKGIIRPSRSPHATNIVCVKKKTINGVVSHRICCDLRQVNEHSIPNRFPNFQIDDAMSKFQSAEYKTTMDFKDAFHMMVLTDESIPITAFYFNNVLFEYVRVPFGHVCAMNAFCCLMALLCVGYDPASYYADDLMITTKTNHQLSKEQIYDMHLEHIEGMLQRIIEAGLKLVAHKCQWCYGADRPMEWLGFTMENNLLKPQESKVKAMKEFPVPTSCKQVISFIATASFYRRFIKSFAKEVQPMFNVAYTEPFRWNEEAQKSFERVKEIMCSDLVLRLPRQGEPFQIYSDASAGALGVVLCQIDPVDGKSHPCAYGSRKFNTSELKLSIPCKELLAIIYGLNLWSFYICGNPIQVFSDCRAWTFLKMQSGASGKVSRLALLVSEYDISISYIKGSANKAADGLSRAYDDGLAKYDDLITARHPALEHLTAPELAEGEVLPINEYLNKCDEYLTEHWPKILKEYENQQIAKGNDPDLENLNQKLSPAQQKLNKLDKEALKEAEYVSQIIQEAAILHVDRSSTTDWKRKPDKGKVYPFQANDDLISEGHTSLSDVDNETDEDEIVTDSDVRTTDSSFKAAVYNIRMIAINESSFSIPAYMEMQADDEFCSRKIALVKAKDSRAKSSGYFLKRGILMRQLQTRDKQDYNVVCVPQILVKSLLESSHRSLLSGHFGGERYYLNMARKYYWPKMRDDIIDFHRTCLPCQYNDKYPVKYSSGHVIRPKYPMHVVHCDLIVGLPKALDGSYAILLLYDGFSRFTFGIPLASEKADYVVKKLMSHFVAAFGLPWALHSDNGRNVDGSLIRHLALMLGVLKTSTPPHTPNANPTETMCGAVSMLLRKALNESDKRYWSLCLPFVLNALNSTVHTATGYTPNSLFFGKFQERDPVPLIPFDSDTANVNEYFQKMRRFQELAFQIVRARNERKLIANKDKWDLTAKVHSFKEGDFVLVKNNNPASGPGKMKLRAKYIGPFRVIKAYVSSLVVVPWTQNSRLEELYKDPNVFRFMHRGDIKPFHTRQVSVRHCKPFRGKIESEEIIDPIMLTRFLDSLGVDSQDELLVEIDPNKGSGSISDSTDSSNPGPPRPPGAPPSRPPSDDSHPPNGPPDDHNNGPPPRPPDDGNEGPRAGPRRSPRGHGKPPGFGLGPNPPKGDDGDPPKGPRRSPRGHGKPPRFEDPPVPPRPPSRQSSGSDIDHIPGPMHGPEPDPGPDPDPNEPDPLDPGHHVIPGEALHRRRLNWERLFNNIHIPRRDRELLRRKARQEDLETVVNFDRRRYRYLRELEVLAESPNDAVRHQAENDIRDVIDILKDSLGIVSSGSEEDSDTDASSGELFSDEHSSDTTQNSGSQASRHSVQGSEPEVVPDPEPVQDPNPDPEPRASP